jgi:hypothetical protein
MQSTETVLCTLGYFGSGSIDGVRQTTVQHSSAGCWAFFRAVFVRGHSHTNKDERAMRRTRASWSRFPCKWSISPVFLWFGSAGGRRWEEGCVQTNRTHWPLYSSSIRSSQPDSLLYTQFSRTYPSSISSSIHSIHCGTHLSLYINISMCDLVLNDLLRRI